jgi:hypothetical protein
MKIVLMDFNFTLVENSGSLGKPWMLTDREIQRTEYRHWLYKKCVDAGWSIFVVTSRPQHLADLTIAHCLKNCPGFTPLGWYFNRWGVSAPASKRKSMEGEFFPKHGRDHQFLAIESNAETRKMWTSLGINSLRHDDPKLDQSLNSLEI